MVPAIAAAQTLPSTWSNADIGGSTPSGSATYQGPTFTVRGGGADIWNASDQFQYVYRQVSGDVDIIARVGSLQNVDQWSKAGPMIRESLSATAAHASVFITPLKGVSFQRRTLAGMSSVSTTDPSGTVPMWLKLERRGLTITAFWSRDGATWTTIGADTIAMPITFYVGIAVTSHNPSAATTATLDNVIVRPAGSTNQAPTTSMTSPAAGSYPAPASFSVAASATDPDGTIAKVDFFANGAWIGGTATTPYSVAWNNVAAGTYSLTSVATDNVGTTTASAPVSVTVTSPNSPPSVTLNTTSQAMYVAPANITLSATASDSDGSVTKVDFYANGSLLGTDTSSPYSFAWNNVPRGSYSVTAVATDNAGATGTSAARTVLVDEAPAVSLTSPASGATFTAPASVTVSANASDIDGTITKVDFYANSTLIGTDTTSPYSIAWNNVAAGSYSLTAIATDDSGATTASGARTITVTGSNQAPTVSLSAPAAGATFSSPATITVSATAADSDGTITKVDFFANASLIGTATSAPYSITWSNVAAGSYSLTAVATDNGGATTTSAARSITVSSGLPSGWSSADVGSPAIAGSTSYSSNVFTVSGAGTDVWDVSDQFQFAYRQVTGDVDIIARVVSIENVHGWSKAGVMVRESLTGSAVNAFMLVSAANGLSFQQRTTAGALSTSTKTSGAAPVWVKIERRGSTLTGFWSSNGSTWTSVASATLTLPATFYVGLAVTSHDATNDAAGVFDSVTVSTPTANQSPTAAITAPASGATFTAPANITVSANASDADGTVSKVDFFANGSPIGTDTTAPYSITWSNVAAGSYSLTAVATDDQGATATSAAVAITVTTPSNSPPTVSLTAPAAGSTYTAPASIAITANAADSDGTVTKVDFYANGSLIGTDTTSPYSFTWNNVAAGSYSLTAVATDNAGATTTSAARSVTVNPASGLPSGWSAGDVGGPAVAGSTSYSSGTFTVNGAGDDVWNGSDQFQYAYSQVTGDIDVVARVASIQNVHAWSKAGVMIREALTGSAANAFMLVSATSGLSFQQRTSAGALSTSTKTPGAAPTWVKLTRRGNTISGFWSSDGVSWTAVASATVTLPTTFYVGLAVTSHDVTRVAAGVFDSVSVVTPPPNQAPTVSLTAPASGATYTAPATVTISANASDSDGTITQVDFYQGSTLIGSDTTSPYSITWNNVPAGTYSLMAVARDNGGSATTSSARTITVNPSATPTRAVFTASSNHATAVTNYVLDIFTAGSNPSTATPVATQDLGKPTPVNGDCDVNVASTIQSLPSGNYIATVTAVGPGGSARSAPSATFTR